MPSSSAAAPSIRYPAVIRRVVYSVIILTLIAPAIYRSYGIFRADRIARTDKTIEGFSRAIGYDPSNATLWWHRGRLRHYSLQAPDIYAAIVDYRQALSLNPRLAEAWADLSNCYDQMGKYVEAEAALEKAFGARRYSPLIRWQAGNFFLRRGNLPRMYECFKMACEFDQEKLDIAMEVAWKIDGDHKRVLAKLIPDALNANRRYLGFLVARDELELAAPVWRRFMKNPIPDDADLKPASAFFYIDRLLARNRISDALDVWLDILRKTRSGLSDSRRMSDGAIASLSPPANLIWNGSFETAILNGGFDWRHREQSAMQIRVDTSNRMEGLKSLRLNFQGENLASAFLHQIIPITDSGSYRLEFCLRTEDLTTDQLPYVTVQGYPAAAGVSARSDFFPATTEWSKFSVPFTAQAGCEAIILMVRRNASAKFDNEIKGSLWLDGFTLRKDRE